MRCPSASSTRSRCITGSPSATSSAAASSAVAVDVLPGDQQTAGLAAHPQRALGVGPQRKRLNQFGFRHHRAATAAFDAALDQQLVQGLADGLARHAEAGGQLALGREGIALDEVGRGSRRARCGSAYGLLTVDSRCSQNPFRDGQHVVDCRTAALRDPWRRRRSGAVAARRATRDGRRSRRRRPRRPARAATCTEVSRERRRRSRVRWPPGSAWRRRVRPPASRPARRTAASASPGRRRRAARQRARRTADCAPRSCSAAARTSSSSAPSSIARAADCSAWSSSSTASSSQTPRSERSSAAVSSSTVHRLQHTPNWSIPIVNLLFRRPTSAVWRAVFLTLKGH